MQVFSTPSWKANKRKHILTKVQEEGKGKKYAQKAARLCFSTIKPFLIVLFESRCAKRAKKKNLKAEANAETSYKYSCSFLPIHWA